MFRKIIGNLSFSPALAGQIGFYARRLRKEEATRRIGLVFVALALVVQMLAIFQAPTAANASSPNDFVNGGLGLVSNGTYDFHTFLAAYDGNVNNLRDIFNYVGISRDEVVAAGTRVSPNMKSGANLIYINNGNLLSWGHQPRFSAAQGEKAVTVTGSNGQPITTVYARPLRLQPSTSGGYWMLEGHSAKAGTFYIMQGCGNLVTSSVPAPTPPPAPKPAPPAPAHIIQSKNVKNLTHSSGNAQPGDKIQFTLTAKNTGGTAGSVAFSDDLTSVMRYATFTGGTMGGGTFSSSTNLISWPTVSVPAGGTVSHSFTVVIKSAALLPSTLQDPTCTIKNIYGTTVTMPVQCTVIPANIIESKKAINLTQGQVDATTVTAQASDQIEYILTAKNTGGTAADVTFKDYLADSLEYATLTDNGGGTFNSQDKTLAWPVVSLKPGESASRSFSVQLLATIPATPQGTSDPTSYDCKMMNVFGNNTMINVNCPAPKVVEQVSQLPHTGPTENLIFAGGVLAIVTYFYARTRQLGKEIHYVRRDLNAGTL